MLTQSNNALQAVKSLAFQRIPVAVSSSYKGLCFEEKVLALKVGPDYIVFRAPKSPLCHTLQNQIMLHSQILPESVRTDLQLLDPAACEMTLTNFKYTGTRWRDRREQRVEPSPPLNAALIIQNKTYRANLNNLSLHGAGLLVYFGDDNRSDIQQKMMVEVSFQLNGQPDYHIGGTIASIGQMDCSLAKMGIQLQPSQTQAAWLEDYIAKRKIEILDELKPQIAWRA